MTTPSLSGDLCSTTSGLGESDGDGLFSWTPASDFSADVFTVYASKGVLYQAGISFEAVLYDKVLLLYLKRGRGALYTIVNSLS